MAFFRRKNQETTEEVPAEIQEYYQAEKRERTGVAWLLALVTLVVTVLLAAALFFGGRWIYRNVFQNNDEQNRPTATQHDSENSDSSSSTNSSQTSDGSDDQPSSPEAPGSPAPESPGSPAPAPNGSVAPAPSQPGSASGSSTVGQGTPRTGANDEPLPSTGPAETTAIFLATTVIATVLHYATTARKKRA